MTNLSSASVVPVGECNTSSLRNHQRPGPETTSDTNPFSADIGADQSQSTQTLSHFQQTIRYAAFVFEAAFVFAVCMALPTVSRPSGYSEDCVMDLRESNSFFSEWNNACKFDHFVNGACFCVIVHLLGPAMVFGDYHEYWRWDFQL